MAFEIEVKKHAFASAVFYIDENVIRFDNKEIRIKDITGFGYMSTQTKVNGINASKTFEIKIWTANESAPFKMLFSGAFGGGSANEKYHSISDQLWNYFGDQMLNNLHDDLLAGKTIEFTSNVKLISKGIVIRRKPLFGAAYEALAEWGNIKAEPFQGMVTFKGLNNKKAKTTERLIDKNVWLLYYYVQWLNKNSEAVNRLMTIPNNYKLLEKVK